jgi:hypothetical protein
VPGKAIRHHHDAVLAALPFAHQDGAGLGRDLLAVEDLKLLCDFASRFSLGALLKSAFRRSIEIAKRISLQPVGEDAKQNMPWQVIRRFLSENDLPSSPQSPDIEIAQLRDLVFDALAGRPSHG